MRDDAGIGDDDRDKVALRLKHLFRRVIRHQHLMGQKKSFSGQSGRQHSKTAVP
jgi:hypothetical protein